MKNIRDAINDFCLREYGTLGDFTDPTRVPILYTTVDACQLFDDVDEADEDAYDEYDLQIYLDLINLRALFCVGFQPEFPALVEDYANLRQMTKDIDGTCFSDWYGYALQLFETRGYATKDWEVMSHV